jgi:hypothetical protein|tara:strand:- start:203 stop:598 length:396 start_codon:yes stop_codon:yes gene_type:complete
MSHHANDELRENQYENRDIPGLGRLYPDRKYHILIGANGAYNELPKKMSFTAAEKLVYEIDAWTQPYVQFYAYSPLNPVYKRDQVRPVLLHWRKSWASDGKYYWQQITDKDKHYKEVIDFYYDHLHRSKKR